MHLDVFGNALLDYQSGIYEEDLFVTSPLVDDSTYSLPYLFRDYEEMPFWEQRALQLCRGSVLDLGCGAGNHSLWLQNNNYQVCALDHSPGAIKVCSQRGIQNSLCIQILEYQETKYDTLLLLMNGIGLAGKLSKVNSFLNHLKKLLNEGGRILLDTSDISYLYPDEQVELQKHLGQEYYGEIPYQMHYKGVSGEPFFWLYCDIQTLEMEAKKAGFCFRVITEGDHYEYLVELTLP